MFTTLDGPTFEEVNDYREYVQERAHPSQVAVLRFFEYEHLPSPLNEVSRRFHDLAYDMALRLANSPHGPEVTLCLRNILLAKDNAVRACLGLGAVLAERIAPEAPHPAYGKTVHDRPLAEDRSMATPPEGEAVYAGPPTGPITAAGSPSAMAGLPGGPPACEYCGAMAGQVHNGDDHVANGDPAFRDAKFGDDNPGIA